MSLNKCKNCGCEDALVTLPPCPTPAGCPDPEPCSEVFDAQCIIYTGADIDCGTDTVVPTDTNVATALNNVVDYFCNSQTQKLRFVKEFSSNLDGAILSVTRAELIACGIDPSLCSEDGSEFSDFVLSIWYLDGSNWRLIQPYDPVNGSWDARVNDTTGDITIIMDQAPLPTPARVRVVIIF
jgi:hypothetical protein